jgi:lincosamide nucleotidyltransferase A/C/D/E
MVTTNTWSDDVDMLAPGVPHTTLTHVLQVLGALDEAGIGSWLEGGWGVDALVGHQTRAHRDVDVDIDAKHEPEALVILQELGYEPWADWRPNRIELVRNDGGCVDLHPLLVNADGSAHQPGLHGEFYEFPAAYFTTGALGGRGVGCFTVEAQRRFHTGYDQRQVDEHDLAQLDRLGAGRGAPGPLVG